MNRPEQILQAQISEWIKLQYPHVYFASDHSGMFLKNWGLKIYMKKSRSKHAALDIIILEPKAKFCGLILELKSKTPFTVYRKLKSDRHLQDQQKKIEHLRSKGYYAQFIWSFDHAKQVIEFYMQL